MKTDSKLSPLSLTDEEVRSLRFAVASLEIAPGHRNLTQRIPEIAVLANSSKLLDLLGKLLGRTPFPVRSIFFDKTSEANWLVPWHQDLSIAVRERHDLPGYGPWSIKDGVPHVQPPTEILEGMVTMRLHLDDCDESNGALQVIPDSHTAGRLDSSAIAKLRVERTAVICLARTGDLLMIRPLLLHASLPARIANHRRVIHLEYATSQLPEGLEWAEALTAGAA